MRVLKLTLLAVLTIGLVGAAAAESAPKRFVPVMVHRFGGPHDSFNAAAVAGAERFEASTGIEVRKRRPNTDKGDRTVVIAEVRKALEEGGDPVIVVGFPLAEAVRILAPEFPDRRFAIIDAVVDLPNVQSVVFKAEEGSFLVGVAAALASKTHKIGFVGGMDAPQIRQFRCGFIQGARHVVPATILLTDYVATDPAGFRNSERAKRLASAQIEAGADVVFHAAGASGIGVIEAASAHGKLAIGADINQNSVRPGTVLTSMMKRVDVAVAMALDLAFSNTWTPGVTALGLAEYGVGWAIDVHNSQLITPAMVDAVSVASGLIETGQLTVDDGSAGRGCAGDTRAQ